MADFAVYWKNHALDVARYELGNDNPLGDWRSSSEWFCGQLVGGDRLWFIAAGETCGGTRKGAYLVNAFCVRTVRENPNDDGFYPRDQFHYAITSQRGRRFWVDPPAVCDRLFRATRRRAMIHIGILLQRPLQLSSDEVDIMASMIGPTAARVLNLDV